MKLSILLFSISHWRLLKIHIWVWVEIYATSENLIWKIKALKAITKLQVAMMIFLSEIFQRRIMWEFARVKQGRLFQSLKQIFLPGLSKNGVICLSESIIKVKTASYLAYWPFPNYF